MNLTFERQISGHYRLQVVKNGKVKHDTGLFKNLITNRGLNRYFDTETAVNNWYCIVGAGNTPPTPEDLSLVAPVSPLISKVGTGSTVLSYWSEDRPGELPRYNSYSKKLIFEVGEATGNIAEVGMTFGNLNDQDQLCSRALVLGQDGNPTVITVLPDEELHVTYEIRHYIPYYDAPINHGTFDADGVTTTVESLPYHISATISGDSYFMHGTSYGDSNTLFADYLQRYPDFLALDDRVSDSTFSSSRAKTCRIGLPDVYFVDTVNNQAIMTFEFPTSDQINDVSIALYFLILSTASASNAEAYNGWQIKLDPPLAKDPLFKLVFTITIKLSEYTP